jgi:hypothetical protein
LLRDALVRVGAAGRDGEVEPQLLGNLLARLKKRPIAGLRVNSVERRTGRGLRWFVERDPNDPAAGTPREEALHGSEESTKQDHRITQEE